jgi:2-C-methyl-D-erythritol 4-phosphate cytidylyltransferase/2-C-methyl-D-erythritol 2,4-cyclodiphosphate synthase
MSQNTTGNAPGRNDAATADTQRRGEAARQWRAAAQGAASGRRCWAVVPAAGVGARVGAAVPKQYLPLAGRSVLEWSVAPLLAAGWIERVVVVVAPGDEHSARLRGLDPRLDVRPVGGAERRDSVLAGIESLGSDVHDDDWVLVHDAARPGLTLAALERLRDALVDHPVGGLLALPVADTVKRAVSRSTQSMRLAGASTDVPVDPNAANAANAANAPNASNASNASNAPNVSNVSNASLVTATVPRDGLWLAQTPQMFRAGELRAALRACPQVTDEASAIEMAGATPLLVPGERRNFKITTSEDLDMMAALLAPTAAGEWRTGQGWDVHALVPGRRLVIGGVEIPHHAGLLGHSDADVLLHALTDALLGAAALGDIGRHFPDTDPRWRGADSRTLLRAVAGMLQERGWSISNVDATVIAQAPKLAPHIPGMVAAIRADLGLAADRVNVKAKTSERLGYAGRGEGIAAEAAVLLRR